MTHASVFSGIGGPEVAATMLGWENLFHCEINPFGRAVLDYWYPNAESYEDITKTDFTPWRGRVDVLTGGFPCQPFSYAGKRRGAEDDRYLWPSMFRCIDEIQPTWVVCENVAGILTMVEQGKVTPVASQASLFDTDNDIQGYELRETFTLQRICDDLGSHGYEVQPILIPACSVGAPHRRDRVFIIGHRIAAHTDSSGAGSGYGQAGDEGRTASEDWREGIRQGHWQSGASGTISTSDDDATDTNRQGREESQQSKRRENQTEDCAGGDDRTQRPCTDGNPSDTIPEDSPAQRDIRNAGKEVQRQDERPASDSPMCGDSGRPGQILREKRRPAELNAKLGINGGERVASDPDLQRCNECLDTSLSGKEERQHSEADSRWFDTYGLDSRRRWRDFPTVAAVHRGNDGLPFNVDDLTLPLSRWRNEALKAYGNAIVPQVMYEIFRAIELVEQ